MSTTVDSVDVSAYLRPEEQKTFAYQRGQYAARRLCKRFDQALG